MRYLAYSVILSMFGYGLGESSLHELKSGTEKEARQFSLFSIVTFKNDQCTTSGGLKGTCLTSSECQSQGTASGNCAASFGVCCCIKVGTCGGTVTRNCSYIESPSYPSDYSTTGSCSYTVSRCQDDICQIRLDFTAVSLQQPVSGTSSTTADCSDTKLDITGGTSSDSIFNNPPTLCGTLTGQHVYIDSGRASTAATLAFTLATSEANKWRIKVTQIECWNPTRAPAGCLQYYYGDTTYNIQSFNWDGTKTCSTGCLIEEQSYTICYRPEKGMCGMRYTQQEVSSTLDSFEFRDEEGEDDTDEEDGIGSNCDAGFFQFHGTEAYAEDRWCGESFNSNEESTTGGTMYATKSNPWQAIVVVNEQEDTDEEPAAGFSLVATMLACTTAYGGDVDQQITN